MSRLHRPPLTVPRRLFVPADQRAFANDDRPLPIRHAQTISAPHIHQMTLHALRQTLARFATTTTRAPYDECHVLDVGCGSGYVVALMCEELDRWVRTLNKPPAHVRVVGIELVPELVRFARRNVQRWQAQRQSPLHPCISWQCVRANGWNGYAKRHPYVFINVGAMADKHPQTLVDQLRAGGRLLVPVNGDYVQLDKAGEGVLGGERVLTGVRFVPLKHVRSRVRTRRIRATRRNRM